MGCEFYDTTLKSSIINQSIINCGSVDDAKLMECKVVKGCIITDSYFSDGLLDSEMHSGIFRSGKLGVNAHIAPEVRMMDTEQNFFNLKTVNSNDGDKIIFNKKDKNVK